MKKVMIMAKSLGGGGTEVAMIELLNKLDENEYDVTLALLDNDLELRNRITRSINIVFIKFKNKILKKLVSMDSCLAKVLKKMGVNSILPFYDILFKNLQNCFEDKYDLALDFYGYGYFLTGYMAKRINAAKKATWLHDEHVAWFKNVVRYMDGYDKIFTVSKAVQSSFCKDYPALREKSEVFYNVIDIDKIVQKSKEDCKETLQGEFVILTVGRLHPQKGYDVAIETANILKQHGVKFCWYAIGEGREETKLKKLVRKKKLQEHFIFLGKKSNPYVYMKQCNLYVQPSRHEGYAITIVEAKTLCLPIVVSDIPSAREQIINNKNGWVVSLDSQLFARKIEEIYEDRSLLEGPKAYLAKHRVDFSKELEKLEKF